MSGENRITVLVPSGEELEFARDTKVTTIVALFPGAVALQLHGGKLCYAADQTPLPGTYTLRYPAPATVPAAKGTRVDENIFEIRVPAPSSFGSVDSFRTLQRRDSNGEPLPETMPVLRNFRPAERESPWPPLHLVHPIFGNFIANARSGECITAADLSYAAQLFDVAADMYRTEKERLAVELPILDGLLGHCVQWEDVGLPGNIKPDFVVWRKDLKIVWAFGEGKREVGHGGGESNMQGALSYLSFWQYHKSHVAVDRTCCPALLIELVGPLIRISGLAFLDRPICEPLTPFLHLYNLRRHQPYADFALLSAISALRVAIGELSSFYQCVGAGVPPPGGGVLRGSRWAMSAAELALPYPLQELQAAVKRIHAGSWSMLYKVGNHGVDGGPRLVKFAERYGADVHKAWASVQCAPTLHVCETLPGGFYRIEMDWLEDEDGWMMLASVAEAHGEDAYNAAKASALDALERAHAVQTRGGGLGVHGDARDNNVMVRLCSDGSFEVSFVDFDWAGDAGIARYPLWMSSQVSWPKPANERAIMEQADDVKLLKSDRPRSAAPPQAVLSVRRPRKFCMHRAARPRAFVKAGVKPMVFA